LNNGKIEIKNLKKSYKNLSLFNRKEKIVFEDLNLSIELNKLTAVTGKNGKGKTTLFKILANYSSYNSGNITINGKNYLDFIKEKKVFLVSPDSRSFYYRLTVMQNLEFFTKIIKSDVKKDEIDSILKFLEIYDIKDNKFYELSTGLMQRVSIARGILLKPAILLIDEPEIGLDKDITIKIFDKLKNLTNEMTVIYSSHRENLIEKADIVIKL